MATDVDELKLQLMELQSQGAFQEESIRSLDEALSGQQQEILLLRRQLELLQQRQREQADAAPAAEAGAIVSERPPHY